MKKITELETSLSKMKQQSEDLLRRNSSLSVQDLDLMRRTGTPQSGAPSSKVILPGRDEYSKATQTLETAFVPCEACHLVQQDLRRTGDVVVEACRSLGLQSFLAKHRATVERLDWLSGTR